VRVEINSTNADYVKQQIREKIKRTTVTVCMVSEQTYTSGWVDWELEESYKKGNNLICMGFKDGPNRLTLPKPCRDRSAAWYEWNHEVLDRLINEAA
jgi:Thoeris protein ThsB, TIR-like domain